jgi:ubiquinone/menaquinone biosynthesis C-methylase UbiE
MEDTDYAFGRSRAEYDRLIEQAELIGPLTERMLLAAGVIPGMRVLDVGCGVGDVSFLVASLVGPEGSVVGVDLDAEALKLAEERRKAKRINNIEFHQSDARSVDSGGLFDAAVGRFVLLFMSDPAEGLRQIAQRVRPGGLVAFHEPDARMRIAPNQPVLAGLLDLFARTFACTGARVEIGAELYGCMRDAGLKPNPRPLAEIPVLMGSGEVAYRRWTLFARSLLPRIVKHGLATEKDVLDILEQLRKELVPAHGLIPLNWLLIGQWAQKPGSAVRSPLSNKKPQGY